MASTLKCGSHAITLAIILFSVIAPAGPKTLPGPPPVSVKPGVKYLATVQTGLGNINLELFAADAPKTVSNFIYLAKNGFYDGLTFHRVVPGHVIQGGCPRGDGYGDAGYSIPFEQSPRPHVPGAVGMARSGDDMNSAGSQFYICLAKREQLDGKYVIFGQVYEGMDVLQKIGAVKTGPGDKPVEPVYIHRVLIYESTVKNSPRTESAP